MLKRTVSGAVYVAIIVAFFLLRNINAYLFDIFIWFFSAMGAFEVARAVKPFSLKGSFITAIIFGILYVPAFCITEYFLPQKGFSFALILLFAFVLGFTVYSFLAKADYKKYVVSILPVVYPALFILSILVMNTFEGDRGFLALLLIFVISPCADVMAYLVGMTYNKIRKGQAKKLCPTLSPHKTVAGGIGGIIGGALGGIIIYFIFKGRAESLNTTLPILIFALVGLFGSLLTEIGDLFESLIKRRAGIKDMGKIMPGHGGVMDRMDSSLFTLPCAYAIALITQGVL